MNTVYLHGALGKRFGRKWQIAVNNAHEVVKALDANNEGFVGYIVKQELEGNRHYLLAKHPDELKSEEDFSKNIIHGYSEAKEVHIVPSIYGGFIATAVGAIFSISASGAVATGISSAIWGGLAQLAIGAMQKAPEDTKQVQGKRVETKSYLLGASRETASQGGVIPLGYGRIFAGPQLIGQSMKTTRMYGSKYLESSTELTFSHLICEGPIDGPVNEYGSRIPAWQGSSSSGLIANPEIQRALYINENQLKKGDFFNYNLNESEKIPFINVSNEQSKILSDYISSISSYGQELFGVSPYYDNTRNPVITVSQALGNYSDTSKREMPTTFSHKINNLNTKEIVINFRTTVFVTRQQDGNNLAEKVYFAVIVLGDDGERKNVLEHPQDFLLRFKGDELVDENGNKLGVFKDNHGRIRVQGIATAAYQFEFPIRFREDFSKNTPTIQIIKLSKETDISAASNVYTTWTTTRKKSWGRRAVTRHEKTDWNSIGGQGRSRSLSVASIEERVYADLLYPNCVTSKIVIDSLNFTNQPTFFWHLRMKKVLIPSNYNANTKKYNGPWNGLFKGQSGYGESIYSVGERHKEWTDNPAWIFFDLLSNPTYGCGKYGIEEFDIDKWELYKIAKYCDEFVETNYPIQTDSGMLQTFEYSEIGPELYEERVFSENDKVSKFKIKIDNLNYYKQDGDLISESPSAQGFEVYHEYNSAGNYSLTVPYGVTQVEIMTVGGGGSGQVAEVISDGNIFNLNIDYQKKNGNDGDYSSVSSSSFSIISYGGKGGGSSSSSTGQNNITGSSKILARLQGSIADSAKGADLRGSSDGFLIPSNVGSEQASQGKTSSTPGYGAGSGAGSKQILAYSFAGGRQWRSPAELGISSNLYQLSGGGSAASAYSRFDVSSGDVLSIKVGAGGSSTSASASTSPYITANSVSGKGGSGRVIVRFITNNYTDKSSKEQFIRSFGEGESFKGKSVAFFINKHNYGAEALNYKSEIKNKSVLKKNCSIERRQIISSDPETFEVTLLGENFRHNESCFTSGDYNIMYGACAAEIDHPIIEHRFSSNLFLKSKSEAINILNLFANMFRSKLSYSSGKISLQQDHKGFPVQLFNNNNVSKEGFTYSGSQKNERFSVVKVMFNNKDNEFNQEYVYEEDTAAIQKIGLIENEVSALSVSSESEARRLAKWILYSSQYEQEVVKFTTSQEGNYTFPGSIVEIYDHMRSGNLRSGRLVDIKNYNGYDCLFLDKSVTKEPILDTVELTVSAGLDNTTIEKISSRASSEKSKADQDFELENINSAQLIKFNARLIPDVEDENRSIALDLSLKMQIKIDLQVSTLYSVYHGLRNGEKVTFCSDGILPGGLSPFIEYYIVEASVHSFKVSLTSSGEHVQIFDKGRDQLLNLGGDHFVVPVDESHTQKKIDHMMIGSIYSIKGHIGLVEDNKSEISAENLSNLGIENYIGEEWVHSSIFGQVKLADKNWLYAKNIGWVYINEVINRNASNPDDYFWFYTGSFGWMGTTENLKSSIWCIPSLRQYNANTLGFVSVFYENVLGSIKSFFIHFEQDYILDVDEIDYYVGGSNRKIGRKCQILTSSPGGVNGYLVNLSSDLDIDQSVTVNQLNSAFQKDKYYEINIDSSRLINAGESLQQKNAVLLNLQNELNFNLVKNYNLILDGVTSSSVNLSDVNKIWSYTFVNETTIELLHSEGMYASYNDLDFSQAKIYILEEFDSDLKNFTGGKYFRILNNKEVGDGKFEIIATEYAIEKFDSIDKKGIIRRPVIPIPPQEGMDVPEAPTNLILTSSTMS